MGKFSTYFLVLLLSSLVFGVLVPFSISRINTKIALDNLRQNRRTLHIIGDSHAYIFHNYLGANFLAQKGMTLTCSEAKIRLLYSEKIIAPQDTVFLTIGSHNLSENLIEKRNGTDLVAKTRFQFFQACFSQKQSIEFILLGLKNIKLFLKGLELADEIGARPNSQKCTSEISIHGHFNFGDGTIASSLDKTELAALNNIRKFCMREEISFFLIPVPVPEIYKSRTPVSVWEGYESLVNNLLPETPQLTMPCEYFFDDDHHNKAGKEAFLKKFDPANFLVR